MFLSVMIALALVVPQAQKADTLPDTPQGKHVAAYLAAFNSGDEATFVQMHEEHVAKGLLAKITVERRKEMFKRMRADFGKLTIERIAKASASQIVVRMVPPEGMDATFTFDFEEAAPFRISMVGVDVEGRE